MARVLIIDDEPLVRATLSDALELAGYSVTEAGDGDVGLRLCREQTPDAVICDIIMPGKDGVTTIGEIHREFPEIGIIAMSGGNPQAPESNLSIATCYGAAHALTKPVTPEDILACLTQMLER